MVDQLSNYWPIFVALCCPYVGDALESGEKVRVVEEHKSPDPGDVVVLLPSNSLLFSFIALGNFATLHHHPYTLHPLHR